MGNITYCFFQTCNWVFQDWHDFYLANPAVCLYTTHHMVISEGYIVDLIAIFISYLASMLIAIISVKVIFSYVLKFTICDTVKQASAYLEYTIWSTWIYSTCSKLVRNYSSAQFSGQSTQNVSAWLCFQQWFTDLISISNSLLIGCCSWRGCIPWS